eukprot:GEMP01014315.1.p1 GENE.GEMP01014315.1~~GEMP01014315.1.p1  ORF type:complete len:748 (+),score=108.86 GEMP01014315.1:350-2593(+)
MSCGGACGSTRGADTIKSLPGPHDTIELLKFVHWLEKQKDEPHCIMLLFLKQYLQGPADLIVPYEVAPFLYEQLICSYMWPIANIKELEVNEVLLEKWLQTRKALFGRVRDDEMPATCGTCGDDLNANSPQLYNKKYIPQYKRAAEALLKGPLLCLSTSLDAVYRPFVKLCRENPTSADVRDSLDFKPSTSHDKLLSMPSNERIRGGSSESLCISDFGIAGRNSAIFLEAASRAGRETKKLIERREKAGEALFFDADEAGSLNDVGNVVRHFVKASLTSGQSFESVVCRIRGYDAVSYDDPMYSCLKFRSGGSVFEEYCGDLFREVRHYRGVTSLEYTQALSHPWDLMSTNSKSGELFFMSQDHKYLIKSVSTAEGILLIQNAIRYRDHLRENAGSLLVHYYGLYRVLVANPKTGTKRKWQFLTVMRSVFDNTRSLHVVFDLKGSRLGRYAKKAESVLKDNDWVNRSFWLQLPKSKSESFLNQHVADVRFLQSINVMDYSILVGIHFNELAKTAGEEEAADTDTDHDQLRPSPKAGRKKPVLPFASASTTSIYSVAEEAHQWDIQEMTVHARFKRKYKERNAINTSPTIARPEKVMDNHHVMFTRNEASKKFDTRWRPSSPSPRAEDESKLSTDSNNTDNKMLFTSPSVRLHYSVFGHAVTDGMILKGPKHIYHVGIIDWLVQYNAKKKLEAAYLTTRGVGKNASCRDPHTYGERQIRFVRDEIVSTRERDEDTTDVLLESHMIVGR